MAQGYTTNQVLDTDVTLAANSDYIAPSEKAVKTYIDTHDLSAPDLAELSAFANGGTISHTLHDAAISGATTVTAGGTTTLTVDSATLQEFTGATTQTVTLPVVSTLRLGHKFTIYNHATGALVTVKSSGGFNVLPLLPDQIVDFYCVLLTGTGAASWTWQPSLTKAQASEWDSFADGGTSTHTAIDAGLLTSTQKTDLTDGGTTTLHTHTISSLTYSDIIGASGDNATVPASSTYYISPFGGLTAVGGGTAYPKNGTLKNFYLITTNTQPATGSLVFTLQVAGSDQTIVITVAAGAGSAVYSDTAHTVSYTGGGLRWKVVNNATSASAGLAGMTLEISGLSVV